MPKRKVVSKNAPKDAELNQDPAFREILELAKSLHAIHRQAYNLIRPLVNDACKNPQTVSEHELEQLFDQVLNISCTDFGMKLFKKLCDTFKSRYPECIEDYIKINDDLYGDGEAASDEA